MTILAVETSGPLASVALVRDGALVAERSFEARMTLNQHLADRVREVVGGPIAGADLDALAVGIGPGSFTGVRVGVAMSKAMAHALHLPLLGVSAPEAIAAGLEAEAGTAVCVLQRARADEMYVTALTIDADGEPVECAPTRVLSLTRALARAHDALGRSPDVVCGDAAVRFAAQVAAALPHTQLGDERHALARATQVARIAQARVADADPSAAFTLTPRYVRLSQAEREFGVDLGLRG